MYSELAYVGVGLGLLWFMSKLSKPTIEIKITDTSAQGLSLILASEITSLNITLSGIRIHKSNAPETSWISVVEYPTVVDLIQLRDTQMSKLIGSLNLPVGDYTQIRFQVDRADITLADGSTYNVSIPSKEVKVVGGFNIQEGYTLALTLDFDSGASINESSGEYTLRPTVKVTTEQTPIPVPEPTA